MYKYLLNFKMNFETWVLTMNTKQRATKKMIDEKVAEVLKLYRWEIQGFKNYEEVCTPESFLKNKKVKFKYDEGTMLIIDNKSDNCTNFLDKEFWQVEDKYCHCITNKKIYVLRYLPPNTLDHLKKRTTIEENKILRAFDSHKDDKHFHFQCNYNPRVFRMSSSSPPGDWDLRQSNSMCSAL